MDITSLVQIALDEAFAMDGDENAVRDSGWLQAHDDRFHNPNHEAHGHFDPDTMTCGLRQKLASADNSDMLEGAGMNLDGIPTRRQFDSLLDRLQASGLIDDDIRDDINRMVRAAESMMDRGDEENFELTGEDKENLKAIAEVYRALNSMEDTTEQQSAEQPQPDATVAEPTTPGAIEIPPYAPLPQEEMQNYLNEFLNAPENRRHGNRALSERNFRWIMQHGGFRTANDMGCLMKYGKDIRDHFGVDHPLTRNLESAIASIAATKQESLRALGTDVRPWTPFDSRNLVNRFRIPHGELTREQVTPQLVDNITARLPQSWGGYNGNEYRVNMLMSAPGNDRYRLERLKNSNNAAEKALYECVKAVHPDLLRQFEEADRREAEERRNQAQQNQMAHEARQIGSLSYNVPGESVDIPGDEIQSARDRLLERYPNSQREIDNGLVALQNGVTPTSSQLDALRTALGADHPLVNRVMARVSEAERERVAARAFRIPTSPELTAANDAVMAQGDIHRNPNGLESVEVTGAGNGYVCYATIQAIRARLLGYDCDTKPEEGGYYGSNRENFIASRGAMAKAGFETLNRGTTDEMVANLERIRNTYPDGTFLDNWTGDEGHGTGAILIGKRWYGFDGYHGHYWTPVNSVSIAGDIFCYDPSEVIGGAITPDSSVGRQLVEHERRSQMANPRLASQTFTDEQILDRAKRKLILLAKRATPLQERNNFSDDQYLRKGYQMMAEGANMSFVLTPDKPLLPETLRVLQPME